MSSDVTWDTIDSGNCSRLSLKSCHSCKNSFGGYSQDNYFIDHPSSCAILLKIIRILNYKAKQILNKSFNQFQCHSSQFNKKIARTRNSPNFGQFHKRQVIKKVLIQMLKVGRLNFVQRPFWLWKLMIPEKTVKKVQSMKSNISIFSRIIINRLQKFRNFKLNSVFSKLKPQKNTEKIDQFKGKRPEIALKPLRILLMKYLKKVFCSLNLSESSVKKLNFMILSNYIQRRLKEVWDNWKCEYVFEYEENEDYEPVNTIKIQVKNFYITNKPCVPIYFYDIHTYVPVFQATVHCLNHFVKRKIRFFIRIWAGMSYRPPSVTSLYSHNSHNSSIDYSQYVLKDQNVHKLQEILKAFVLISQKRNEMPKFSLCKWIEACNIQNLKVHRLILVILNNQKKNEKKRTGFHKMSRNTARSVEFTDIN